VTIAHSALPIYTGYFSLYKKAKPLYPYQSFLSQFEKKSNHYALLVGKREVAALFTLIERVKSLQNAYRKYLSKKRATP
jgi:hypothetical protein